MVIELEGFITVRQAARECHRSTETIRRWAWDGKLHAEKVGGQLFVRRSDLARLCGVRGEQRKAARLAALDELKALRERIRQRGESFDVVEAIHRSRDSHPQW